MKALVLSMNSHAYAPRRLAEEFERSGVDCDLREYLDVQIDVAEQVEVRIQGTLLSEYDLFILRTPVMSRYAHMSYEDVRRAVVTTLGSSTQGLLNAERHKRNILMDKLNQAVALKAAGLPVIETHFLGSYEKLRDKKMDYPVIMKQTRGSHGMGVNKISNERSFRYYAHAMNPWNVVMQPFMPGGEDVRILVLGSRVLGAIKRKAINGSHLTNVSAGGQAEVIEVLDAETEKLAVKAAQVMGLEYAGVDIMCDGEGKPHILEVNDSAQMTGFEKQTGINVAGKIVAYLKEKVA